LLARRLKSPVRLALALDLSAAPFSVDSYANYTYHHYNNEAGIAHEPAALQAWSNANPPSPTFGKNVVVFDPSELKSSYNLMMSTVTPRSIALVSSRSSTGVDNVSPFSYFNAVAHDPPILAIGFCRKGGLQKDSLVNILETKQFAVNIISDLYLDAANHACGNFAPEIDEFLESGMTKVECISVAAPRVAQAAVTYVRVSFGARLVDNYHHIT
jgi:flavin reductase (DIM6/NTAB) family NADH-FMN oxidoreductase RutF